MIDFHLSSYNLFPYEVTLAQMEIAALARRKTELAIGKISTPGFPRWDHLGSRATYCEFVTNRHRQITPIQTQLERASSARVKSRQRTRYSSHGLHEYKGKFNPQVVRAIGNIIGLRPGSTVLDPFCGSGTVLVEAIHNGWDAYGADINPMAVEIATAKTGALRMPASSLTSTFRFVAEALLPWRHLGASDRSIDRTTEQQIGRTFCLRGNLRGDDYLSRWFPPSVLLQLEMIEHVIGRVGDTAIERIFRVLLSDHLRSVSQQDEADLRIRRRKQEITNAPLIARFIEAAGAKIGEIAAVESVLKNEVKAKTGIGLLDARDSLRRVAGPVDAIITSPPYAMALPYIDTQRLSLSALGLVSSDALARLERELIGSRDITVRERRGFEAQIDGNSTVLPDKPLRLCRRLLRGLDKNDGFRRRNLPSLLFRYFLDMQAFMTTARSCLRTGGHLALVVGKNETTIGGRRRTIDTPELLAIIGESVGYSLVDILALDAYQRFGLHAANGIRAESLVLLRTS